jgi:hypothetical protein
MVDASILLLGDIEELAQLLPLGHVSLAAKEVCVLWRFVEVS